MDDRGTVLDYLARYSYDHSTEKKFRLASGDLSDYYIDCKPTTMRREAAEPLARLFLEHIPSGAQAVGGLTAGADPIAYAIRDFSTNEQPLHAFMVRKEPKSHGLKKIIEGPVSAPNKVVVVDDVVTRGSSTVTAIEQCQDAGLEIVAVIVLVDRQRGGMDTIRAAVPDVPVTAIFKKDEIHAHWAASPHERAGSSRPKRALG